MSGDKNMQTTVSANVEPNKVEPNTILTGKAFGQQRLCFPQRRHKPDPEEQLSSYYGGNDRAGANNEIALIDESEKDERSEGKNTDEERERPEDAALLSHLTKGDEITIIDKWGKRKNRVVFIDDRTTVLRKFSNSMFAFDGTKRLISLREVSDIIDGAHTEAFQRNGLASAENRCFSLVFGNGCKTIDFVCSDAGVKKAWVHGLTLIISRLMPKVQTADDIAQSYFQLADINGDGRLSVDEVCVLLKRLHLNLDRRYVKDLFKLVEADSSVENKDNHLDRKEFLQFVKILYHCREIERIYESAKGGNEFLNRGNFSAFLSVHQRQFLQEAIVSKLMIQHELSVSLRGKDMLSYEGFRLYMMSDDNSLIKSEAQTVYQDMTKPLPSYWIFSSHNTYLIGNQLTGESSTNGYTSALNRGCRCVEIDSWDGDSGEPIVTHGRTLTTTVLFRDVIHAIKTAAFITTPYPVIISIENHCGVAQQKKMAEHMKQIFGDALCTSLADPKDPTKVLSPEALKFKFLVKGKKLKEQHQQLGKEYSTASGSTMAHSVSSGTTELENKGEKGEKGEKSGEKSGEKQKTAQELSDVTVISANSMPSMHQEGGGKTLPVGAVSSIVESECQEFTEHHLEKLIAHTNKYLVRVYPTGLRTSSSNYNPMPGIVSGCQLVALNCQTTDKYYKMYSGLFIDNGYSGFVLKELGPPVSPPITFHIQIIGGYQLGKVDDQQVRDIIDPFVIVRMYGDLEDKARFQTSVVKNNGFNPIWNETFTFRVTRPDIALLRFIVMDENPALSRNTFIAQYTLPARLVREGFRYVRLDCEHSSCSALLVHVTRS